MDKEELIKHCRYYRGEEENPLERNGHNNHMFWFYELRWVEWKSSVDRKNFLIRTVADYCFAGLSTFRADDGTPVALKAILFNRYEHWMGGYSPLQEEVEDFKKFYLDNYIRHAAYTDISSSTRDVDDEISPFDMRILGAYGLICQGRSKQWALRKYHLTTREYDDSLERVRQLMDILYLK